MNNVDSEKVVNAVQGVLEGFGFETYIVAIKDPKKEGADVVAKGDTETMAKLLLAFINAVPKPVIVKMQQYLLEYMAEEGLRKESDE